ncbi:FAM136A-like protein [Perilla frutescens var. hirtella]|nr:FAM136A-like protein [Perilla frutescens var. hirtella]KAH6806953.1 FAM136A-like protein [Perilla frutescens var. frutescens]
MLCESECFWKKGPPRVTSNVGPRASCQDGTDNRAAGTALFDRAASPEHPRIIIRSHARKNRASF